MASALEVFQSQASSVEATAHTAGQNFLTVYFSHLTGLEVISVLLSAGLIAASIMILIKTSWIAIRVERFQNVMLRNDVVKKGVQREWKKVQTHFFSGNENDLKVAVMEADKLLDEGLRDAGIIGRDLGERLRRVKESDIPNLNEVWQAHKLRNQIAHEPGFKLKRDLAERALNIFEKALAQLGAFDEPMLKTEKPEVTEEDSHSPKSH